jgi:secondary thiamine-phosphate synthase enzyme
MNVHTTSIETKAPTKLGRVDLTGELVDAVRASGAGQGIVLAYCRHTTCALVVNEWERGAHEDAADCLETMAPPDRYYAHDDMTRRTENIQGENEPANGQAHVLATIVGGASQVFPIVNGAIDLGRWQRLMLLELDDPKPREVTFTVLS